MTARLLVGDCLEIMRTMPSESIDAVVTDPPAGISFMNTAWDHDKGGRDTWIAWLTEVMREALRLAKPGAHAFVWALPRTSGWTHRAIEDAGWEIRDCATHIFGSGFPKSLDISKQLDKAAGVARKTVGHSDSGRRKLSSWNPEGKPSGIFRPNDDGFNVTAPATDLARQWGGWGTALKPAAEFWYLARKPLSGSVAANVTTWGVGGLNIAATRIGLDGERPPTGSGDRRNGAIYAQDEWTRTQMANGGNETSPLGRWPANLILDEAAAALLDEMSGELTSNSGKPFNRQDVGYHGGCAPIKAPGYYGDTGGCSRFFYTAKASRAERTQGGASGKHPTQKPIDLMQWLCRLICPPGGTILDPFCGSGSTGVAADREGFHSILIEQDPEYAEDARRKIIGDAPLFAEVVTP